MALKKIIGKLHLILGVASGLVVFVVALTGVILVFEVEIDEFVNHKLFFVEPQSQSRLSIDKLMAEVQTAYPEKVIEGFDVDEGRNRAIRFTIIDEGRKTIFVHPYTGQILGAIQYEKRFFTIVLKLHRYLLAGDTGKAITGISTVIFIILLTTGIVLWFPKNMAMVRQRLSVKWDARWRRVNYDLHSTLGFYACIILFFIAATGLVWSYKAVNNAIFVLADGKPQERKKYFSDLSAGKSLLYESIVKQTNDLYSYAGNMSVTIPENDSMAITVYKENLEAAIPNVSSSVFFDQNTGKLIEAAPYEKVSLGMKIRRVVYPLHTGSLFGLPTQILAMVVSLFAASLPVSGVLIWWGRRNKANKNRSGKRINSKRTSMLHPPKEIVN